MKRISFEKALRYQSRDVIFESKFLKNLFKDGKNKTFQNYNKLKMIADETPMCMETVNNVIKDSFDELTYIDIMYDSNIYLLEN